jgi:hypothetical protein
VSASFHTVDRDTVMQAMRQADIDRFDFGAAEQFVVVRVDDRACAEALFRFLRDTLRSFLSRVAERGNGDICQPPALEDLRAP